jgi:uncharacterized protein (DUF169 family)
MMMDELKDLNEALEKYLRVSSFPVGIRLAREGDKIPQKGRYPLKDIGHRLALCQGVNLVRIYRWTMVFSKEDHACPGALVYLGHISPKSYLKGGVSTLYVENEEIGKKMEATYPLMPEGSVAEVWIAPLDLCQFDPDVAVIYAMPGQIVALIQAANFRKGTGIHSRSTGRGACASWLIGTVQSNECTYVVPGGGEKIFGGTQDHEMAFSVPRSKFKDIIEGLEYVRKQGGFRFPIPVFGTMAEPKFPEKYKSIMSECE